MINTIWLIFFLAGFAAAAINGRVDVITTSTLKASEKAVTIAIGMISVIAFWLGLMRLMEKSGLTLVLARVLRPVVRLLFREIPPNHPANGAIVLNLSANLLGLGNAATPLGLKAMQHLQDLNREPGRASPSMCTLLALNTSSLTIVPTTVLALRAASGALDPADIVGTTLVATAASTLIAVLCDRVARYLSFRRPGR